MTLQVTNPTALALAVADNALCIGVAQEGLLLDVADTSLSISVSNPGMLAIIVGIPVGGGTLPPNAWLDAAGDPILDPNGDFIILE